MLLKACTAAVAALVIALPVALGATPPQVLPGQRVDLKVLLISADGTEPGYGAWKAELDREGVPYDTLVATTAAPLSDAQLADYGADHARYQAVILASGDLGTQVANANGTTSFLSAFTDAEWATLAKFERTFGIRQLSDYTAPGQGHGLNTVPGASQDGVAATLTDTGKAAFPYLRGPVTIADDDPAAAETFGYPATPVAGQNWQTLLAAPNGNAFLGIYTHPDDGREEMVMTVASNQFQNHNQLLRHGMLNWVTRGVFLGYERNYLELQVDDLFLGDDAWNPATHSTNYDPAAASRMTPGDVDRAIAWSRQHNLRLDFAYNGSGSDLYEQEHGTADPLLAKFRDPAVRGAFGYINHTFEHPNLDCSTASFISSQISQNLTWGRQLGLAVNPAELITGEHSGLANSRPGNPGTIDPPIFDELTPTTGGSVPAGTYDYAISAHSAAGESTASVAQATVAAPNNAVRVTFNAICHATSFDLYRKPAGATTYTKVGTLARDPNAATDDGSAPIQLAITDTAATGTAGAPPATNGAALAPYPQNPNFTSGITAGGVKYIATDASKDYPPAAAGQSFLVGPARAIPRYPSNVYYNVSKQGQQLDEYNWIYVAPATGGCVPIANVTTCRTTKATWDEYVTSETRVMFRHLTGNDPRPHYMHQSNLADYNPALPETDPAQGGVLYPVVDALLGRYEAAYDRAKAPLVQLTATQIGDTLARADAWTAARPNVTAWLQDGRVYVRNGGTSSVQVPLTGTTTGDAYGSQHSGWITLAAGAEQSFAPAEPTSTAAPSVSGDAVVGKRLTATPGTWTGTAPISYGYQWQRCDTRCVNVAGATGSTYDPVAADRGKQMRVVVQGGNWIASVSHATSAPTAAVTEPPATPRAGGTPGSGQAGGKNESRSGGGGPSSRRAARLRLTKISMAPRRFAVAHRRPQKGTRLDGSRISWRLSKPATVRLTFQRRTRHGWKKVGRIERKARAGENVVRFRGRFGSHLLAPRRYRLVITATSGKERTRAKHVAFRVVAG